MVVMEASGGSWGPEARKVFSSFANSSAKLTGEPPSLKTEAIYQTLCVILHRANALSILTRSPDASPSDPCPAMASARAAMVSAEIRRRALDPDDGAGV